MVQWAKYLKLSLLLLLRSLLWRGLDLWPGNFHRPRPRPKTNQETKKCYFRSSRHGAAETNPTRNHEGYPGLAQWVKDPALP